MPTSKQHARSISLAYRPELEGIRAIAFLFVFAAHYTAHDWNLNGHSGIVKAWYLACQAFFCAVPLFFVLSGYLITGILLRARGTPDFFTSFYRRRAFRILPLYYIYLIVALAIALAMHTPLRWRVALFPVYLQNTWPTDDIYIVNPLLHLGHLWSLAVEEQFYLLWPLAIFCLRTDKAILKCCYIVLVLSFLARSGWLILGGHEFIFAYTNTAFRCDGLILGSWLFLKTHTDPSFLPKLRIPARITLGASVGLICVRAVTNGSAMPFSPFGVAVILPLLSLMGLSLIVLTLSEGTLLKAASSARWTVGLGKRSYGLYVIHQLFLPMTLDHAIPYMNERCGNHIGHLLCVLGALVLTLGFAEASFRYIEKPAARLARKMGPPKEDARVPLGLLEA